MNTDLPKQYLDLVGTTQKLKGFLFSYTNKKTEYEEYDVLKWRWGSGQVFDKSKMRAIHPTVEFLLKNKGMKRAKWSKGIPVREIYYKQDCYKTGSACKHNCSGLCKESC